MKLNRFKLCVSGFLFGFPGCMINVSSTSFMPRDICFIIGVLMIIMAFVFDDKDDINS